MKLKRGKITYKTAVSRGFTIDKTCHPWVAYKGPRWNPTIWHHINMREPRS